jgi:hypothetical protein
MSRGFSNYLLHRRITGRSAAMRLEAISVDYVVVDTLRVPRETFATILEAWRDGYAEPIGQLTPISQQSALAYFGQMIAHVRDRLRCAVWMVPIVSARMPEAHGGVNIRSP